MSSNGDPGYSMFEDVLGRDDVQRTIGILESRTIERTRAGARHLLKVPAVRELASDPRLLDIARRFLASPAIPFRATLFDKSPTANWLIVWHQDTALPVCARVEAPGWGPWSTKAGVIYAHAPASALQQVIALRVSLDDSTAENGPLRVLPHTHRRGLLSNPQIEQLAKSTVAIDCVAGAGGVIAMRPLTVHASSKSRTDQPRRVLHIEYATNLQLERQIELAVT